MPCRIKCMRPGSDPDRDQAATGKEGPGQANNVGVGGDGITCMSEYSQRPLSRSSDELHILGVTAIIHHHRVRNGDRLG